MRPTYPGAEGVGFRCEFCGSVFADLEALHRHLLSVHAGRPRVPTCDVCKLRFRTSAELKEHNELVHGAPRF